MPSELAVLVPGTRSFWLGVVVGCAWVSLLWLIELKGRG